MPEVLVTGLSPEGTTTRVLRGLLDTGTTETLVLGRFLNPDQVLPEPTGHTRWQTLAGVFTTHHLARFDFQLPEFSRNKTISRICHVESKIKPDAAPYDIIIGTDLMAHIGLDISFSRNRIEWEGNEIPLIRSHTLRNHAFAQLTYERIIEAPAVHAAEDRQERILDADYAAKDLDEVTSNLTRISREEQSKLAILLKRTPQLFSGGLGRLHIPPVTLELLPGARPYHARAFPIPQAYELATKQEIQRLTDLGVFKRCYDCEWAAPTFIHPKTTGGVGVLTDFRRLNDALKCTPFPLPRIADLLQKLQGFQYATALDLSMGYYHVPLDEAAQRLCTALLPWGKYQYQVLPMGIKNSPDIFQNVMNNLLGDLENVRVYLDDILVTTPGTFTDHLNALTPVLHRLDAAGFRANIRKCTFATSELEYLGYWLTRNGIQPQPKKVEAILRLEPPKNKRQLRTFLGMVNYYRDMWKRRSHVLAPLSGMVSPEAKFVWGPEQQKAFKEIKTLMSRETILRFPDFGKEFHIFTDASDYQLGAVIMQDDLPLAFYSRKMNSAQRRYTTGEQ